MSNKSKVVWEMAQSICAAVYGSDFGRYLWLLSPQELDEGQNIRRLDDGIRFLYKEDEALQGTSGSRPGSVLDEAWGRYLFNFLRKQLLMMDIPILLQGEVVRISDNEIFMELQLTKNEVYVPLRLSVVRLTDKKLEAEPVMMTFLAFEDRSMQVLKVSSESIAVDHTIHILKDLELIGEMEPYLYLYEILSKASMDGKSLCLRLEEKLREANLYPAADNRKLFDSYGSSTYMKKRWKTLLRRQKLTSPAWDEVHEMLSKFIDPVLDAIERDMVFFGDWMPGLGRYLD